MKKERIDKLVVAFVVFLRGRKLCFRPFVRLFYSDRKSVV